jgi:hypothetical protein
MFKDAYAMIRKCHACKTFSGKMKRETMPLNPILAKAHFHNGD